VLFLYLGLLLVRRGQGDRARQLYLGVYAVACVLLFSLSGTYHMLPRSGTAHQVLGRLDYGAIFVLIAGTFTPAHGLLFRGLWRWGPLLLVWSAALTGIVLRAVFYDELSDGLSLTCYLALGWLGALSAYLLARRHGLAFVWPLLLGGLAYTVGGAVEYLRWGSLIPGVVHPHEICHVLVLIGALCHWRFVWQFAQSPTPVADEAPCAAQASMPLVVCEAKS
jgi:channel protein (hemolysin III family)